MKILVFGASAGLGRQLADMLGGNGHTLLLVASDPRDLDALAADLSLRHGISVTTCSCAVGRDAGWLKRLEHSISRFGLPDALIFSIGAPGEEDDGLQPYAESVRLLDVNLLSVVGTISSMLPAMIERRSGTIVGIGSVAAARGRGRNVLYSAAKRALDSYFESLRHLTANFGIHVQFYRMGYLDTEQSYGRALMFPPADPRKAAEVIAAGLWRRDGVFHLPTYWRWILVAVRLIPWPVFRRLRF